MRSLVKSVSRSLVASCSHRFSFALREFTKYWSFLRLAFLLAAFWGEAGRWRVALLPPVYLLVELDEAFLRHVSHRCEVCPPVPPDLGP
jgi:hypothetical protein